LVIDDVGAIPRVGAIPCGCPIPLQPLVFYFLGIALSELKNILPKNQTGLLKKKQ